MDGRRARSLKIAFIGGGSRQWARKLMADLALCPDLGGRVSLHDIDVGAASLNARVGNFISGLPASVSGWSYEAEPRLEACLEGADFVVISVQPGSLELMGEEIAAAARRGRFFPVGDTTGAPGLARALRSVPLFADFAHAIMRRCPDAFVINYTNPMAFCVRAMLEAEPRLRVVGCCHEVPNTLRKLAAIATRESGLPVVKVSANVYGVNHFTFLGSASADGRDLFPLLDSLVARGEVLAPFASGEVEGWKDPFRSGDRLKFSLFRDTGSFPAAGDRHLAEFLPGFCASRETLLEWGVSLTPVGLRIARRDAYPTEAEALLSGAIPPSLDASGEDGVAIMKALLGLGDFVTNANLANIGQIPNLPLGTVVETNALFHSGGVTPLAAGALPAPVLQLVAPHAAAQDLVVDAALAGKPSKAFPAFLADPATALPLGEARSLFDELLALAGRDKAGAGDQE